MNKTTKNDKRRKANNFEDSTTSSINIASSWVHQKLRKQTRSMQCQTTPELFNVQEMEIQSGRYTRITQDQVMESENCVSLVDFLSRKYNRIATDQWKTKIEDGFVTVDCEVEINPESKLGMEYFVEYVDTKSHVGCQTSEKLQFEENTQSLFKLSAFLRKVLPLVESALEENQAIGDIDYMVTTKTEDEEERGKLWKCLLVDFEKKKLVFPDWTNAKHFPAVIVKCTQTRNKERVYDIEYDDGSKLQSVREEHIRILSSQPTTTKGRKNVNEKRPVLQEGMRVHAKITSKSGITKYFPGRIVKISRNLYDIEIEGSKVESGLMMDDLIVGLLESQQVEARKPTKVQLQCTSLDWNCTGNMIVATYGRNDLTGWCDIPGAMCSWNLSSRSLDTFNPDVVLDHSSSLTKVCCHPIRPSLVAAGSFNGEVIIWDLSNIEQSLAASPITEYSHKEPVTDLKWVYNPSGQSDDWLLLSIGADGKVLFWSLDNKLRFPVKGFLMKKRKNIQKKSFLQCFGATSMAVSVARNLRYNRPKWLVIGQEGGAFTRCLTNRLFTMQITNEIMKSPPVVEELFPSLINSDENTFSFLPHVGAVTSIDWSPFNRSIFVSGGSDGEVRLYNILEQRPILHWHILSKNGGYGFITSVKFSPWRPMVFAVATAEGNMHIYDLRRDVLKSSLILDFISDWKDENDKDKRTPNTKVSNAPGIIPIADICFNNTKKEIIAAADWKGRISIWKLSPNFANFKNDEVSLFENLCKIDRLEKNSMND